MQNLLGQALLAFKSLQDTLGEDTRLSYRCRPGRNSARGGDYFGVSDERAGALETAERRFLAAALDYGSTEMAAQSR